jgi:uncharacterized heparinase superfamily protein
MRNFLYVLACTGGVLLLCDPAAAQSASRVINLSATVDKFCRIANAASPAAIDQALTIDTDTMTVDTTPISVNIGRIRCNAAASFQLSSTKGALLSAGATAATDFAHFINYTASISTPVSASVNANVTSGTATVTNGTAVNSTGARTNDNVTVTITPTTTLPLVHDGGTDYTDTLTITIAPL